MRLPLGALVPHPPIMLREVGGPDSAGVAKTARSMDKLADSIVAISPEVVVLISPHGPVFADAVAVMAGGRLKGDLSRFGASAVSHEYETDVTLSERIVEECTASGVQAVCITPDTAKRYRVDFSLDHGALVPLHSLWQRGLRPRLVFLGSSFLPLPKLYVAGMSVRRAVEACGPPDGAAVLLASGDLSHRLTREAPNGYDSRGLLFDEWLVDKLREWNVEGLMEADKALLEKAGECGFRSVVMLAGAMDGQEVKADVLSYEGPFGVGYCVASVSATGEARQSQLPSIIEAGNKRVRLRREAESMPVKLARLTVERHILGITPVPDESNQMLSQHRAQLPTRAGVFVSIKKFGDLRGCIGTIGPTKDSLAHEIEANAIEAATADPRFDPIDATELDDLIYSVDILSPPEEIDSETELDVVRYGVIVSKAGKRGLLLPNLEGVETVAEQLAIAKRKAGIHPGESVRLQRFEVVRYE